MDARSAVRAIERAGVVGAGGGAFPTHAKAASSADTVIANGAECEPLLAADTVVMTAAADRVLAGLALMAEAVGARRAIVAVKAENEGAVASLSKAAGRSGVELLVLENVYPAGDEFLLVHAATGRVVPEGGLPTDVGVVVNNVTTLSQVAEAVEKGVLKGGVMYECIKHNVPYVLAGSIRDDGPLPDVITDTMVAQDMMRERLQDADIVLMMATMLHAIASGNCLPSNVRTICVDINPATVTKLMDRGSAQAIGIVTDVGTFLPRLSEQLAALRRNR